MKTVLGILGLVGAVLAVACAVATEDDPSLDVGVDVEGLSMTSTNNTDVALAQAVSTLQMAGCYAMQWAGNSAYNCNGDVNSATCNKLFGAGSGPDHITVDQCVSIGGLAPIPTPPGGTASLLRRCHTPSGSVERGSTNSGVSGTVLIYNRGGGPQKMVCRPSIPTLWFNY